MPVIMMEEKKLASPTLLQPQLPPSPQLQIPPLQQSSQQLQLPLVLDSEEDLFDSDDNEVLDALDLSENEVKEDPGQENDIEIPDVGGGGKEKTRKRRNIRNLMSEEEMREETRAEQERELERMAWLRQLHRQEEERVRKRSSDRAEEDHRHRYTSDIIQIDDSDGEGEFKKRDSYPGDKPAVITLSSDEESEDETEKPLTGYDDTAVSERSTGGMHTDDSKNVRDSSGRVIVNVNHPPEEPDIFLRPCLASTVKPHQIGGVRFLYDNIVESVSRYETSPGFGCLLAHTMGLGKTLQTISFVDICLRDTPTRCILIVVPVNVLQNWMSEFDKWIPASERGYPLNVINDATKTFQSRATLIKQWNTDGGVMILGYEMFRVLALTEPSYAVSRKLSRKRKKRGTTVQEVCDIEEEEYYMDLLKSVQTALLNPGPDLIICDEGHRIKNAHATISKALKKIKTRRRIVLTGYPLQNNLEEYWCMVDFVRPNFLGTKNEFNNMFVRPMENGQCVDSTHKDTQLMKMRSHVLHSLLEGFVQRRDQTILERSLKSKLEYVLCVKMSPLQKRLLKRFAEEMDLEGGVNPIYAFTALTKIWNHPDVLQEVLSSAKLDDLDMEGLPRSKLSLEWARDELHGIERGQLEDGSKMVLLMEIIQESVALGDKVVVFSQSLLTLSLIEHFLHAQDVPVIGDTPDIRNYFSNGDNDKVKWTRNKHYFRLDGSTNAADRSRLIKQFNKKGDSALLFLVSTKAGSLGVNLIGSNRVVIMDVSWNPCHDAQAVCRIYRYGQTKPSFVYRFVAEHTLERTIYNKQIAKQGMSSRVVDEQNVEKQFTNSEIVSNIDNMIQTSGPVDTRSWSPESVKDGVLRRVLERHSSLLTAAPFTHESLLMENKNDRLSAAEKVMAKKSYQFEKQMNKAPGGYYNVLTAESLAKMHEQAGKRRRLAPELPLMSDPLARSRPSWGAAQYNSRPVSPPPAISWNNSVIAEQSQLMSRPYPYLSTFRNPSNQYYDTTPDPRPTSAALEQRKLYREQLQKRLEEGQFDFNVDFDNDGDASTSGKEIITIPIVPRDHGAPIVLSDSD